MTRLLPRGFSFAPPLDEATLERYEALSQPLSGAVKYAMIRMLDAADTRLRLPSVRPAKKIKAGPCILADGRIVEAWWTPLSAHASRKLKPLLPTLAEFRENRRLAKSLSGEVAEAFYHLMWFMGELKLERASLEYVEVPPSS